jgi:hypothetical protein
MIPPPPGIRSRGLSRSSALTFKLSSFALTCHVLAQDCRPYIFRTVNLGERARFESGYNKLRDVLKENSSLADHTRELHLFAEHVQGATKPGNDSSGDAGESERPRLRPVFGLL